MPRYTSSGHICLALRVILRATKDAQLPECNGTCYGYNGGACPAEARAFLASDGCRELTANVLRAMGRDGDADLMLRGVSGAEKVLTQAVLCDRMVSAEG
ncbi:MAG: hypothetical protein EHM35_21405 [Planctomycetaceae bacterium]|nr:MAG: hypothetical protein EHM35_21405 [Planctomycetaceae bacterium]